MKKSKILALLFLLIPFSLVFAQVDLKAEYGQKTYDQYLAEDWTGLIETGKEALAKNTDFYYLRIRMGIAYAAQANFRMAIVNYKKALEFVPEDPIAQEYLYYAYLYSGMKNTASVYAAGLPSTLRKKIKPEKLSAFGNIYMETGFAFANYSNSSFSFPSATEIYFSELFKRKSQTYFNTNLLFNVAKSVSFSFGYTGLGVQSEHQYQLKDQTVEVEDLKVSQKDISLSVNIHTDNGITLIPFFHNVNTSFSLTQVDYDTTAYELEPGIEIDFSSSYNTLKWNDQLVGFGFVKKNGLIDIAASLSYSWLNQTQQKQLSASLTYLPKGNYSLYFTPEIRLFNEDANTRTLLKLTSGFTVSPQVWAEAAFTYGNLKSTNENFGAIVYNLPDKTKFKADAVINYGFSNGVSLSLRYQLTNKESALNSYRLITTTSGVGFGAGESTTETNWTETETSYPFNQHFIILGFNWAI
ncbi:MAG: hypothetical protein JW729_01045 [Bacteroidales bacterium]|nr:hypothetical protein [Bacteroidales bacterium]